LEVFSTCSDQKKTMNGRRIDHRRRWQGAAIDGRCLPDVVVGGKHLRSLPLNVEDEDRHIDVVFGVTVLARQ